MSTEQTPVQPGHVSQHFVEFFSPGTFVAETSRRPVEAWNVEAAVFMAAEIEERHGARPYGFQFVTRGRSPLYYLGGEVRTYEQVVADNRPDEAILRDNMRINGWGRIITTRTPWAWTQSLRDTDIVLKDLRHG